MSFADIAYKVSKQNIEGDITSQSNIDISNDALSLGRNLSTQNDFDGGILGQHFALSYSDNKDWGEVSNEKPVNQYWLVEKRGANSPLTDYFEVKKGVDDFLNINNFRGTSFEKKAKRTIIFPI